VALTRAAILVMAPAYVGLPLGALVWTQGLFGPAATTWLIGTIALSDSAQYYTGRLFGRTKLAPAISPAKTREGALGGLVAAAVSGWFVAPLCIAGVSPAAGSLTAVGLAAFGIAGDLFESMLKRSAGLKDSSQLIPGHGGVLDRIDSYLFAAPVFYLFLRYIR
jgi:phosphatidate cytidylyltransferase